MKPSEQAKSVEDSAPEKRSESYPRIVWRQFKKNRLAMAGLVAIGFLALAAIAADLIAGNKPYYMKYRDKTYYPAFRQYAVYLGVMDWPKELKRRREFQKTQNPGSRFFPPYHSDPGKSG